MKTILRLSLIAAFASLFSCDPKSETAEAIPAPVIQKTDDQIPFTTEGQKDSINRVRAARVSATYIDVPAGNSTISGAHDAIRPVNGSNITLSNAVFYRFDWSNVSPTGTPVTITVPGSSEVVITGELRVPKNVTYTNNGKTTNLTCSAIIDGVFANPGRHYVGIDLILNPGSRYSHQLTGVLQGGRLYQPGATIGGYLNLLYSKCSFDQVQAHTNDLLRGNGYVTFNSGLVRIGQLTKDATVKLCVSGVIVYELGGVKGPGVLQCP